MAPDILRAAVAAVNAGWDMPNGYLLIVRRRNSRRTLLEHSTIMHDAGLFEAAPCAGCSGAYYLSFIGDSTEVDVAGAVHEAGCKYAADLPEWVGEAVYDGPPLTDL